MGKNIFKQVLENLMEGELIKIVDDEYDYQAIWYSDGFWWYKYQNCFSDTCNCVSHPKFITKIVPRRFVLELIRKNINNIKELNLI